MNAPRIVTGTTSPIYIAGGTPQKPVVIGEDYFLIKIHSAQVAYRGSIWQKVKELLVTSNIAINHPHFGAEKLSSIQRSRQIKPKSTEQLGLSINLTDLLPCIMSNISVTIDYLLNSESRFTALASLINDKNFTAIASMATGSSMAAKTVSGLSSKIIQTLIPAQDRQPLFQFTGDFNLAEGQLKEGFYAILGSSDKNNPIPDRLPDLEIDDVTLTANGKRIDDLSYIVLEVIRTPARGRALHGDAAWDPKLCEAEDLAREYLGDPFASIDSKKHGWELCTKLILEARALLRADFRYLPHETDCIIASVLDDCRELVKDQQVRSSAAFARSHKNLWEPDFDESLNFLGIDSKYFNKATIEQYAEDVFSSYKTIKALM